MRVLLLVFVYLLLRLAGDGKFNIAVTARLLCDCRLIVVGAVSLMIET